jgi:amidase
MLDLHFRSATQLASAIQSREVSSVELLTHFLDRINALDNAVNAVVELDRDIAFARAEAADLATTRGERWGPLHGVPITVKEAFNMTGLRTTFGYEKMRDNVANEDAIAVRRLRDAGAVVFGKTNVPVALSDWQTFNPIYGTTNNPWDLTRTPGGSSGGSAAALAAGFSALELGSDIGASIRNPAHYCGVFGHKPTFGTCTSKGHMVPPYEASADLDIASIGPLARSASDLALTLGIIAGADDIDSIGWQLRLPPADKLTFGDFRVGLLLSDPVAEVDEEVQQGLRELDEALRDAGVTVDVDAIPAIETADAHRTYLTLLRAATSETLSDDEFSDHKRRVLDVAEDDTGYEAAMLRGTTLRHRDWLHAHSERYRQRHIWAEYFERYDLLLCPAATTVAFPHNQSGERWERMLTVNGKLQPTTTPLFWAGYAGNVYLPATVAPLPPGTSGLPRGVQIIAPQYRDYRGIHFAALVEQLMGGFRAPSGY